MLSSKSLAFPLCQAPISVACFESLVLRDEGNQQVAARLDDSAQVALEAQRSPETRTVRDAVRDLVDLLGIDQCFGTSTIRVDEWGISPEEQVVARSVARPL